MASTIDWIDESEPNEIEVTFFGEVTTEESGHDAGEAWGAKYPSTIQSHDIVEVIEWDRTLYTLTDNDTIQQHLDNNMKRIEAAIIKDFQTVNNDRF